MEHMQQSHLLSMRSSSRVTNDRPLPRWCTVPMCMYDIWRHAINNFLNQFKNSTEIRLLRSTVAIILRVAMTNAQSVATTNWISFSVPLNWLWHVAFMQYQTQCASRSMASERHSTSITDNCVSIIRYSQLNNLISIIFISFEWRKNLIGGDSTLPMAVSQRYAGTVSEAMRENWTCFQIERTYLFCTA